MKNYYADKYSLKILYVINIIIIICIIISLKYLMYYILGRFNASEAVLKIGTVILITAYVVFAFVILPLWYRSLCYTVSTDEIIIQSGIIFENMVHVKIAAIQYTTVVKCPFSSKINFNFLLMNIYGGRFVMMFLSLNDLEEINRVIQMSIEDRGDL